MAQADKFTLEKRLVLASGFHVRSLSKRLIQKIYRSILLSGSVNQFDELAFRRRQLLRLEAFPADYFYPLFDQSDGEMSLRCRGTKQAFEQEFAGLSTGQMALKLFLETLKLQGQLSGRPPEIFPL